MCTTVTYKNLIAYKATREVYENHPRHAVPQLWAYKQLSLLMPDYTNAPRPQGTRLSPKKELLFSVLMPPSYRANVYKPGVVYTPVALHCEREARKARENPTLPLKYDAAAIAQEVYGELRKFMEMPPTEVDRPQTRGNSRRPGYFGLGKEVIHVTLSSALADEAYREQFSTSVPNTPYKAYGGPLGPAKFYDLTFCIPVPLTDVVGTDLNGDAGLRSFRIPEDWLNYITLRTKTEEQAEEAAAFRQKLAKLTATYPLVETERAYELHAEQLEHLRTLTLPTKSTVRRRAANKPAAKAKAKAKKK